MALVLAVAAGYLLGSIPFGLLIGRRAKGVDLREFGSGKTGFTNSLRVLGLRRSLPVLVGDFSKGAAASLLPLLLDGDPWLRSAGGLAAVAGHVWPLFAGFRGGRGVLAGGGALMAMNPLAAIAVLPVVILVVGLTRYVSLGSICGCIAAGVIFTLMAVIGEHSWAYAVAACAGGGLIIVLHKDNIARLRAGTERKLGNGGDRRLQPEASS